MGTSHALANRLPGPSPRVARSGPMRPAPTAGQHAQPLAERDRARFSAQFGSDFSRVRVHTDSDSAQQASARSLKAFAAGEHIVFSPGRYRPGTPAGERLLAHELAHVAQQQRGGPADAGRAEQGARHAADQASRGEAVSPQALGGAPAGVYGDPDDTKPAPGPAPEQPTGSLLPPIPNFQLQTLPPIDWFSMHQSFRSHGMRLGDRDADSLSLEWQRSSKLLDNLGIDDHFKFLFFTKQWILNKGLNMQLDDRLSRENPNSWDTMDKQWKDAHPGGWQTPMVPIFDIDWLRSKKK